MRLKKDVFKSLLVFSVMIFMNFLILSSVNAAEHVVSSNSTPTTNIHNNISSAIDSIADNGDVITINAGTYKGNNKNTGITISKNVTIQSAKYAGTSNQDTIIDGEGLYQIFNINPDCYVNIYGITFINGKSNEGGAIYNEGNLNITDSTFKNNVADYGGAIYCYGDEIYVNIKNSNFINNSANSEWESDGGAFANYADNAKISVSNSNFINNKACWGGAFVNNGYYTEIEILRSNFTNNTVECDGGAFHNFGDEVIIKVNYCNFDENSGEYGGALASDGVNANIIIENSNFTKNSALNGSGGAIYLSGTNSIMNITSSKFKENMAQRDASVLAIWINTKANVSYCRFANNNGTILGSYQDSTIIADYNWWGDNKGYLNNVNTIINNYFLMVINTTQNTVKLGNKITYNYYFVLNDSSAYNISKLPYFVTTVYLNGNAINSFDARYNKTGLTTTINSFTDTISSRADNQISSLKFSVEKLNTGITSQKLNGTYNKTVALKATLKDANNKYIVGQYVKFYINNKYVGQAKTNSNGLAVLNYKVTNTGTLQVKYSFDGNSQYISSLSTNTVSIPKMSYINIKNSKSVKGKIISIKSILINNGPDKATFKVYYKLPKGFIYSKPKVTTGTTVSYNSKTRILTWNLKNLKTSKTSSAILKWNVKAPKKGKYTVAQDINKISTVKLSSKNKIAVNVK